jgi:uncharacterized protein YoxC
MAQDFKNIDHQIQAERIRQLEDAVLALSSDIQSISQAVRDLQRVVSKIATTQGHLAERITSWPYVKVTQKKPRRDIDNDE